MPCKMNLVSAWDSTMNETEENKDLAWKRIGDSCGLPNGELQRVHVFNT